MKKKLGIILASMTIIICITLIIYAFTQKENDVNIEKKIVEESNIIQEYHGMFETNTGWDYILDNLENIEKELKCYDTNGNFVNNPKNQEWNILNCYLYGENGQIMMKSSHFKENLAGEDEVKSILSYYYENGNIESETTYINGEKNGEETGYYENGQIASKKYFKNGKMEGIQTDYYKNGQVVVECEFTNGLENGKYVEYNENGQLRYEGNYLNGQKNGLWIIYDEEGHMRGAGNYINGEQNGKRTSYYENGQKEQEAYFTNGLPDGEFIRYYEDGNINTKGNYKNGVVEGKVINYYENGKILSEATFKNGELVEEKKYDENGKLIN